MQHSKKFLAFFGALLCTLPLLMGPTGGFPSRPTFQTATSTQAWSNGTIVAPFKMSSASPALFMSETDQAVGEKNWLLSLNAKSVQLFSADDSGNFSKGALIVQGGAAGAISSVSLGNVTDNPTFNFLGTGTVFAQNISLANNLTATGTINAVSQLRLNGVDVLPVIVCTTACNASTLAVGQRGLIRKIAATNRASTTTPALDPDLQFTSLPAGVYQLSGSLLWAIATQPGGINLNLFSTVAAANDATNAGYMLGPAPSGGACNVSQSLLNYAALVTHSAQYTCTSVSATGAAYKIVAVSYTPTAGTATVGIDWSQASSNVTATTLQSGSFLEILRLQ